jgi:hypothetical protein
MAFQQELYNGNLNVTELRELRKLLHLKAYEIWIIHLEHLEHHCKVLSETPCVASGNHIEHITILCKSWCSLLHY